MGMLTWEAQQKREETAAARYEPGGDMYAGGTSHTPGAGNTPSTSPAQGFAGGAALGSTKAMMSKSSAGAGGGGSGGGSSLTFPSNLGSDPTQMNMMMFTAKEITGGSGDSRTITFRKSRAPVIALPIPAGINESFQQSWSAASVAGKNAMWSDKAGSLIKSIAQNTLPTATNAVNPSNTTGGAAGVKRKGVMEMVEGITSDIGRMNAGEESMMTNLTSGTWWDAVFGGVTSEMTAMVAAGPMEGLATASQYTTGMRAVQQSIMSYGGPGFRSFNYNFSLKPFSAAETETVARIVDTFKQYSAPNQQDTRYTRVYDLPCVFKIQFFYGGQENRYIGHIGHCALSNFSVSYGGGKFTTFAGTHAPVQVDISLQFQEMELLNREMMTREYAGGGEWPLGGATAGSHNLAAGNAVNAPAAGSGPS